MPRNGAWRWSIPGSFRFLGGYHIDLLIVISLSAALLDIVTTYLFISRGLGFEANPVCGPLFSRSLVWIPVYLLVRPLLVPFLPEIPRRTFAGYFLSIGLVGGVNNLGGILFHKFFLVDTVGFWLPLGFCVMGAIGLFIYQLRRNPKDGFAQVKIACGFPGVCLVIEGAFYLLGVCLRSAR